MAIFKKKQPDNQTDQSSIMQTAMQGTEMHFNPSPETKLSRMEARLARVTNILESGKFKTGTTKEMEFQTIKRRLTMEISLLKGDY